MRDDRSRERETVLRSSARCRCLCSLANANPAWQLDEEPAILTRFACRKPCHANAQSLLPSRHCPAIVTLFLAFARPPATEVFPANRETCSAESAQYHEPLAAVPETAIRLPCRRQESLSHPIRPAPLRNAAGRAGPGEERHAQWTETRKTIALAAHSQLAVPSEFDVRTGIRCHTRHSPPARDHEVLDSDHGGSPNDVTFGNRHTHQVTASLQLHSSGRSAAARKPPFHRGKPMNENALGLQNSSFENTGTLFTPVGVDERISSLDVIRGVAVLGILLMNIVAFGLPLGAYSDPSVAGGASGLNLAAWITTNMLFEGTFRTLFSVLFGAGVVLFTTRAERRNPAGAADLYYRRNLWLISLGVVHAYLLLWIGEILYAYGLTALFLFVFRHVGPRKLLVLGLLVLAVLVPKRIFHAHEINTTYSKYAAAMVSYESGGQLTPAALDAIAAWRKIEMIYKPTPEDVQQEIQLHQGGYLTLLIGLSYINVLVQGEYYYLWNFWDVLGAMLLGMAALKMGILSAERSYRFYVVMIAIGYGLGLALNAWETQAIIASRFDLFAMNKTLYTYDLGRLAVAAGHLGVVMLICKRQLLTWLRISLASVGRMALTNYIMQTVICVTVFSGFGGGLYGELQRYQLYYVVGAIWVVQMVISPIWLRFFQFGPLEWFWRSLTYWKLQPLWRRPSRPAAELPAPDPGVMVPQADGGYGI